MQSLGIIGFPNSSMLDMLNGHTYKRFNYIRIFEMCVYGGPINQKYGPQLFEPFNPENFGQLGQKACFSCQLSK